MANPFLYDILSATCVQNGPTLCNPIYSPHGDIHPTSWDPIGLGEHEPPHKHKDSTIGYSNFSANKLDKNLNTSYLT